MAGSSDVVSVLVPFFSWAVMPQLLSKLALRGLYDCQILQRPTTPVQAQLHTRRVQVLVIVGYLLYTVYATIYRRDANYYEILGVPLECDADQVRRAFRRLARIYHPDKVAGRQKDEMHFIQIRKAHDCLADATRRIAYDRFGSALLDNRDLVTEREFFLRGLQDSLSFYLVHPISFGFVNWLAGRKVLNYWTLTLYTLLLASEFSLIVTGRRWNTYGILPSTMTAHDLIVSLHSAYTAVLLASTHLGLLLPTLRNPTVNTNFHHLFDGAASEKDLVGLHELVLQQEARMADVHVQAGRNQDMTLLPLRPSIASGAITVQQAANDAARRRAKATPVSTSTVQRQPSRLEQTYIHQLGQLILRHRLESIPTVREALRKREREKEAAKQAAASEAKIVPVEKESQDSEIGKQEEAEKVTESSQDTSSTSTTATAKSVIVQP